MHKRERLAQRASLVIETLLFPITTTKGQGFYVECFLGKCLFLGVEVQNVNQCQALFPAIL